MKVHRSEDGAVTAEAAVVLPVLIVLTAALAWLVALGVRQVQVVDAAREAARALARGEDESTSTSYGEQVAPDGSRFRISRDGDEIRVEVTARTTGPGGVFGFLPGAEVSGTAVARAEP